MKSLTLFTNLYSHEETIYDVRRRGKAVRLHPTPEAAQKNSRPDDPIAEVALAVPMASSFVFYREVERGMVIFGQSESFTTAYRETQLMSRGGKAAVAATLTPLPGGGKDLVHLSSFITGISVRTGDLEAA